uniref:cysteine-rich secretory protein LCCL domain-containing 2-like n=1 Tax=Myxine glutinosa TaxID=7769 RepID=UPI00358FC4E8
MYVPALLPWLLLTLKQVYPLHIQNGTSFEAFLAKLVSRQAKGESIGNAGQPKVRQRRYLRESDQFSLLNIHNKLRGQVSPSASNMEYMVWDEQLAMSAADWAKKCVWDHGPSNVVSYIGQNLGVYWGRPRPLTYHVRSWYNEVNWYAYPGWGECNPSCPMSCSGPVCTHYTQLVWATTNRMGCAVNYCNRMSVWGMTWENAFYLVCNYAPKGNWMGQAPYRRGSPCSRCPPSYGGRCKNNLCYPVRGLMRYT